MDRILDISVVVTGLFGMSLLIYRLNYMKRGCYDTALVQNVLSTCWLKKHKGYYPEDN